MYFCKHSMNGNMTCHQGIGQKYIYMYVYQYWKRIITWLFSSVRPQLFLVCDKLKDSIHPLQYHTQQQEGQSIIEEIFKYFETVCFIRYIYNIHVASDSNLPRNDNNLVVLLCKFWMLWQICTCMHSVCDTPVTSVLKVLSPIL